MTDFKSVAQPFEPAESEVTAEYGDAILRTALGMVLAARRCTPRALGLAAGLKRSGMDSLQAFYAGRTQDLPWQIFVACCAAAGEDPCEILERARAFVIGRGSGGEMAELLVGRSLQLNPETRDEILDRLRHPDGDSASDTE